MHSNAWSRQGMACPQYRCVACFTQHRIAIKTADQAEHENEFSQHKILIKIKPKVLLRIMRCRRPNRVVGAPCGARQPHDRDVGVVRSWVAGATKFEHKPGHPLHRQGPERGGGTGAGLGWQYRGSSRESVWKIEPLYQY